MKKPISHHSFIRVGSVHEPKELLGLSHLLEHVIFNSGISDDVAGIETFIDEHDISDSAETSMYYTKASLSGLTKSTLDEARKRLFELLGSISFSDKVIAREKSIVTEEIAYTGQMIENFVFDEFDRMVFKNTSLEHPIIGPPESVANIDVKDIAFWHEKFYRRQNIVEAVYNQKTQDIKITPNEIDRPPDIDNLPAESRKKTIRKGLKSSAVVLGWLCREPTNRQRFILDIISMALGGSNHSFMYKYLTQKEHLIYTGRSWVGHYSNFDFLGCYAFSTKPQKVLSELQGLQSGMESQLVDGGALDKVLREEIDFYQDTTDHTAVTIAKEFANTGELVMPEQRIKILKSITKNDVLELWEDILSAPQFCLLVH